MNPGLPLNLLANSALSAAVMTTVGGHGVSVMGDWDGQEDLTADHAGRIANLLSPGVVITRSAMSEHTMANGFAEDVFYYGDSEGNLFVAATSTFPTSAQPTPNLLVLNLPTILNAFGTLNSDSQIVVTGLAVNPVADLSSFSNVNGSFAPFNGLIGEVLYVTFTDTGGGFRLSANNQLVRSGILAFPVADVVSPATAAPGVLSAAGYPVTVGGSFGVAFSIFSNLAGVAVDDDGNTYFQQVDLVGFTGANIVKITDTGANQDRSPATNGFLTITTLNPSNGLYGNASGPAPQVNSFTNYSGTSTTFGNITALASGPGNVLYAAVARSFVATDDQLTQNTEGLFANPAALGPTPSMIISFADCGGSVDGCTAVLPVGNNIAEVAAPGLTLSAGVNNFRVFAMGDGPDVRGAALSSSPVLGTVADTLKLNFQIDYTIYAGLAVDEEGAVYVVSGGTPAGVGRNPSQTLGEMLLFPDINSPDRRADFIDLRGDTAPNPPTNTNSGDGDSDRFDHIFWQAPMDMETITATGISGLARGFLLYTNRTRTVDVTPGLPNGGVQGDDSTSAAAIGFGQLDPGHQVGGGDDQTPPFRGDDSDGGGSPVVVGAAEGGFEFTFNNAGTPQSWNSFFLNSNGNITFGAGDTSNIPTVNDFLTGLPRIAAAWSDINPNARAVNTINFPVQAVGFAGINHFKVRFINVPTFGSEACNCRNTFSVSLFDDGTALDENSSQTLNAANPIGNNAVPFDKGEGPTALRWVPNGFGQLIGSPARVGHSGYFTLTYGRMDLIGEALFPVLVGFSAGTLVPGALGQQAMNLGNQVGRIGNGFQTAIYEFFNTGVSAAPAFDLRFDGNHPLLCTPGGQADQNKGVLQFSGFIYPGHQPFSNEPATAGVTLIRALDVTQLRIRINLLRARVTGMGSFVYTDVSVTPASTVVLARITNEMRQALNEVYVAFGLAIPAYTDGAVLVPGTTVKAIHIQELRGLVGNIE